MPENTVEKIVEAEWKMLLQSAGEGVDVSGDEPVFKAMRRAQYAEWSEDAAESYLADLEKAQREGRNLIIEKNIRMMQIYAPEQYEQIKSALEPISEKKAALVLEISDIMTAQMEKCHEKYPFMTKRQLIHSSDDTPEAFSAETYQKGELATCSEATLEKLKAHLSALEAKNESLTENILSRSMELYGYKSLAEAEKAVEEQEKEVYVVPKFECGCSGGSCSIDPIS